ncbi:hypothetical protein LVO79_09545 [Roseivivax marinus]|uniref:hypothetical protein n=1 Tax=Roseivivax marinus TaxID=1379903 RepID=UPI001F03DE7F|nr:hypothetical protein [Roseivivax marinus]UMA63319.1 hypothetical protein LVO79_09545 [Roseivivax marinus]
MITHTKRAAPAVAATLLLFAPHAGAQDDTCTAPAAWFPHDQTPPPDDNADFNSNCAFHQWSWQAFLALTKDAGDGKLAFETLIPSANVISGTTSAEAPDLMPRVGKSDSDQAMGEINQAGSLGLLVDQGGRAVYYSQYVDDTFFDFVITEHGFNDPEKLLAASDTLNYPVGALTLKAAWMVVPEGGDASDFYTTEGDIRLLAEDGTGRVVVDPDATATETLALVGLHVVGVVKGHPEAIWATFEHVRNAPDIPPDAAADTPVSLEDFTFYSANTNAAACNQNNAGHLTLASADDQTLSPVTQVCRQFASGGGSDANAANIAALNESVHAQLESTSVWQNYTLVGAVWFSKEDALQPAMLMDDSILTGSVELSNSTIETFTQKTVNENNCFACHNTQAQYPTDAPDKALPAKNLNISHVLVNTYLSNLAAEQ